MTQHICFSGSFSCSGCNPCPACLEQVRQRVLPFAMVAGGFNNSPEQAHAFIQGFLRGWQNFFYALDHDPTLQATAQRADVATLIEALTLYEQHRKALQSQMAQPMVGIPPFPAGSFPVGFQAPPSIVDSIMNPTPAEEAARNVEAEEPDAKPERRKVVVDPRPGPGPSERVRSLTQEMDAEEIAAAALPIRNGAVLGNVLQVPPGMEAQAVGPSEHEESK